MIRLPSAGPVGLTIDEARHLRGDPRLAGAVSVHHTERAIALLHIDEGDPAAVGRIRAPGGSGL